MKLTITNLTSSSISIGGRVGRIKAAAVNSFDLTIADLEALRPKLVDLASSHTISWVTANDAGNDSAEGATVSLTSPTFIPDPPAALNANTTALAQAANPIVEWSLSATRKFDPRNAPTSMSFMFAKMDSTANSVTIDVTTGGNQGWTTNAGLNTDFPIPAFGNSAPAQVVVRVDKPNKTVHVYPST